MHGSGRRSAFGGERCVVGTTERRSAAKGKRKELTNVRGSAYLIS